MMGVWECGSVEQGNEFNNKRAATQYILRFARFIMSFAVSPHLRRCFMGVLLTGWLSCASQLEAQPALPSVIPADGATNIATISQVIFTFSTTMSSYTQVYFTNSFGWLIPVTSSWSAGNTVLTCTPTPPFPTGTVIYWFVN